MCFHKIVPRHFFRIRVVRAKGADKRFAYQWRFGAAESVERPMQHATQ
jgi:hypothetical protein